MVKKKNELSHYPSFFFSKLAFRTICGIVFAALFVGLGKKYLKTDILGKIWESIFNEKKSFNQYFLGNGKLGKNKILNCAIFLLATIVILNVIVLGLNRHLGKKDQYIENNKFYLHNKGIFFINSLIHIASACLLILSFISLPTIILALLFITFNSWGLVPRQKRSRNPQVESFFSGKSQYVRKIAFYSAIVVFIVPLVIGRFQAFHNSTLEGAPEGFAKVYQTMINSSLAIKSIMELITQANYSVFHGFILLGYVRCIINERPKEFADFGTQVNGIEKRVNNFKHHYYYQASGAIANNTSINLGDYSYLENSPKLLSKSYLESNLDVDNFAKENQKIVKYVKFCENEIKEPSKNNFLNYCLFNEFNSGEDCLRTRKLIKAARQ